MKRTTLIVLMAVLMPTDASAVDGVVLINQATIMAAGGFPYVITSPGSYRLTGNLTMTSATTSAISVRADNVTIDLNGFSIIGPVICIGSPVTSCSPVDPTALGFGIEDGLPPGHRSVTVMNGNVRGMGSYGIGISGVGGFVEKVHAESNGRTGIFVASGTINVSMANLNGQLGFESFSGVVSGNVAIGNGRNGFFIACPTAVIGNMASGNGSTNLSINESGCAVANNAAP